jgi:glycosyltransferase involved in cell wall biosynthesis
MHPRILIVCEHASARFGGEAALPLHYFRVLRNRGYAVWLITHARTRTELTTLFPGEERIHYIEDTRLHRLMWHASRFLPSKIAYFSVGFVQRFACQLQEKKLARRLIAQHAIDVVHQPMPVSPREPSMMYGLGAPVVIGPMNGGLDYPPAFRKRSPLIERLFMAAGRCSASALNWLMPGKRRAAFLLVANELTRRSLPAGVSKRVIELVENGVDLSVWRPESGAEAPPRADGAVTFLFLGRLVALKSVDLLLLALQRAAKQAPVRLVVAGDGPERVRLQSLAAELGLAPGTDGPGTAIFTGWLPQTAAAEQLRLADCLVLPSVHDCGGAVILEAMCVGKPVIATAWGGPMDYVDDSCGLLVPPDGREQLVQGFADAMVRMARAPQMRHGMGNRGREKARAEYDWEIKVDRVLEIYRQALAPDVPLRSGRSTSRDAQTTLR